MTETQLKSIKAMYKALDDIMLRISQSKCIIHSEVESEEVFNLLNTSRKVFPFVVYPEE